MSNDNSGKPERPTLAGPEWDEEQFKALHRAFKRDTGVEHIIDLDVERMHRIAHGILILAEGLHGNIKDLLVTIGVKDADNEEIIATLTHVTAFALHSYHKGDQKAYASAVRHAWANACAAVGG